MYCIPLVCVLAQDKEYLVYSITSEQHLIILSSSEVHQIDPRTHLLMNEDVRKREIEKMKADVEKPDTREREQKGRKMEGKNFV